MAEAHAGTAPSEEEARQEAEDRAHDRIVPTDPPLGPIAAVELYVEAFLAGVAYAGARR